MTYNKDIPQSSDFLSNSQGDLLANFQAIDSSTTGPTTTNTATYGTGSGLSVDHFSMNTSTSAWVGMHFMLDFPVVQTSDPTALSGNNNYAAIYTKTGSTYAEPYFLNASSTSGNVIWYGGTGNGGVTPISASSSSNYLNLPNGIQFRWGYFQYSSSTTVPVTYTTAFSNNTISVQLTPTANAASTNNLAVVSNGVAFTNTGFTAITAIANLKVYYFAVGY